MKLDDTQYRFTPDSGTVKPPVYCGVCKAEMNLVLKDSRGPRGWAQAVGMHSRGETECENGPSHDVFLCPHADEMWHKQVICLREEAKKTSSARIANIILEEVAEVLSRGKETKSVSILNRL